MRTQTQPSLWTSKTLNQVSFQLCNVIFFKIELKKLLAADETQYWYFESHYFSARNPSSTKGKSQATLEPKTKGSESKSTTEKPSPAINNEKQAKEATSGVSGEEAPEPEPSVKPSQPQDAVKESPESEPKPGAYPALVKPSSVPDTTIPEPTLSNAKDPALMADPAPAKDPAPVQDEAPAKEAPPPVVRQNSRRDRPPGGHNYSGGFWWTGVAHCQILLTYHFVKIYIYSSSSYLR